MDDEVIQSCLKPSEEQDEADSAAPPTSSSPIDIYKVKDHLMKIFGHLLSREELVNGKTSTFDTKINVLKVLFFTGRWYVLSCKLASTGNE